MTDNMALNKIPKQHYLVVSALFLLSSSALCTVIYLLVANIIHSHEQLLVLQQQLVIAVAIITALSSGIYILYQQKYRVSLTKKSSCVPKKKASTTASSNISALRILAVDDNPANLLIIDNYLQLHNIPVTQANSGFEALNVFAQRPFDMILMDIEMDGMNGIETTQAIRAIEKSRTPIIAVSAHGAEDKRVDALMQGFDDYIAKPVNEESLLNAVRRWGQPETSIHTSNTAPSLALASPAPMNKDLEISNTPPTPSPKNTSAATLSSVNTNNAPKDINKVVDTKESLLHSNHNPALAKDMLDLLIQMVTTEKESLRQHYEKQEWEMLYQLNHKIYGGSSYCGVPALQQANQTVEKLLQQKLHVDNSDTDERSNSDALTGFTVEKQEQHIKNAIHTLLQAIDDVILWGDEYDTGIVFGLDE